MATLIVDVETPLGTFVAGHPVEVIEFLGLWVIVSVLKLATSELRVMIPHDQVVLR